MVAEGGVWLVGGGCVAGDGWSLVVAAAVASFAVAAHVEESVGVVACGAVVGA